MAAWLVIMPALAPSGSVIAEETGGPTAEVKDPPGVVIEQSPYRDAVIYSIVDNDCTIKWTAYSTDLNRGVVKHWARCPEPLVNQIPLLTDIVREFLARDPNARFFHTLFWGGLVPEQSRAALEMSFRLALAAARSPGWDARRGKPTSGDLNRFVKDLANREPIYPELRALFGRLHRSIAIASMEKVRVLEAGRLPFYDNLKKLGVSPADKLPFDSMVWFSVSERFP